MMHSAALWRDPRRAEAVQALAGLEGGARAADIETETLDFKEDQSRRLGRQVIEAGATRHEPTARDIAEAACCFANSLGGVVIIGVDDRATGRDAFIGTDLDPNWLPYFGRAPRQTMPFVTELLVAQGSVRAGDLVEYCGLKPMQASRVLAELRDSGVLTVGSAKAVGKGVFYVPGPHGRTRA